MDPPASRAALETYDEVRVLKGVQTVRHGGGGSGGTVLFERDTRALAREKGIHGHVSLTGTNNGTRHDLLADMFGSGDAGYVRVLAQSKNAENYEDGSGREVRSSYDQRHGGVVLGHMPSAERLFEWTFERSGFDEAPYDWREKLDFEAYVSDVDHVMDNFSLRRPPVYPPGTPKAGQPMKRATLTTSKTMGGRLIIDGGNDELAFSYGVDFQENNRNAVLNNMDGDNPVALSFLWPDVSIRQFGILAEAVQEMPQQRRIRYGLRGLDRVDASAGKADDKPAMVAPNVAYRTYYRVEAEDETETNLGGLIGIESDISEGVTLFTQPGLRPRHQPQ